MCSMRQTEDSECTAECASVVSSSRFGFPGPNCSFILARSEAMRHWLSDVFTHPDPLGLAMIAGKVTVIYLFLVVGLRLLGKRELGQMTIYDLVLIIVLANSVQNAMVGTDTSLVGGI